MQLWNFLGPSAEGRGSLSLKLVCVVVACVYTVDCRFSQQNNGLRRCHTATAITRLKQKKTKKTQKNVAAKHLLYSMVPRLTPNHFVFGDSGEVFGRSRLKTETGRARFRETGKVMQGNGARQQPAHRSLLKVKSRPSGIMDSLLKSPMKLVLLTGTSVYV